MAVSMLAMSHGIPVCAQSIDQANADYKQFIQLSNSGNQAQMYDVLYRCYTSTKAVLDNAAKGSADYRMAYDNEEPHTLPRKWGCIQQQQGYEGQRRVVCKGVRGCRHKT